MSGSGCSRSEGLLLTASKLVFYGGADVQQTTGRKTLQATNRNDAPPSKDLLTSFLPMVPSLTLNTPVHRDKISTAFHPSAPVGETTFTLVASIQPQMPGPSRDRLVEQRSDGLVKMMQ